METTFFVKVKDRVLGPMNMNHLVEEIQLGSIPKTALWSANKLLWSPLATFPDLFLHKIPDKGTDEPKPGVFLSTETNRLSPEAHTQGHTPLQWALILGGSGVMALVILMIMVVWPTKAGDLPNNNKNALKKKEKLKEQAKKGIPNNVFVKIEKDKLIPEEIVDLCAPSVAEIVQGGKTGSGFLVAKGLLVTHDKVVKPLTVGDEVEVQFHSAKGLETEIKKGTILKRVPHRDLAFVKVDSDLLALELAPRSHFWPFKQVVALASPGLGVVNFVLPNART